MKNQTWKWMIKAALLTAFAMLFARCEMGLTETIPANSMMKPIEGDFKAAVLVMRGQEAGSAEVCACLTSNFAYESLSQEEKDALIFMREEEKLARDVYLKLGESWEIPIFSNIARSEQRHMDAVLCLIEKYELTDPLRSKELGQFSNENFERLYSDFTARGAESLEAALLVGAEIEDLDIFDLQNNLATVNNEDIFAVFNELMRGSRNHLRAFTGFLKNKNVTYERQYLSEVEFDKIINTEKEKGAAICSTCPNSGGRSGRGGGSGNGWGGRGQGSCNGTGQNGFGAGNGTPNGNCLLPNNGNKETSNNVRGGRNRRGN